VVLPSQASVGDLKHQCTCCPCCVLSRERPEGAQQGGRAAHLLTAAPAACGAVKTTHATPAWLQRLRPLGAGAARPFHQHAPPEHSRLPTIACPHCPQVSGYSERVTWVREPRRPVRVQPDQIVESVDRSLARLQTDHLDLLQVCVRVCVRACVRECVHVCVRACVRVCVRACVCACMRACVRACVHACVRACARRR